MRARGRYWWIGVVPAFFFAVGGATPARGQVVAVPQQDLAFGLLLPGVPSTVLVSDAARRAEWLLTGRGNTTISFVLPSVLSGPAGAVLPLAFTIGDAGWQRQTGGGLTLEDPNAPFSVNVPNRQTIRLFLGGTAQPAGTQTAGSYTATVTVIIAQP